MDRRAVLSSLTAVLCLALLPSTAAVAADLASGATAEVKANSMWFEEAAQLSRWQQMRRRGNAKALAEYEGKIRAKREAWQFTNPLSVKILNYNKASHQVKVEQLTAGRLQGSVWYVDDAAF